MSSNLDKLNQRLAEVNALHAAQSMMDWDHQCYMPKKGAEARGDHLSVLSKMSHELFTSDETQRFLEDAGKEVAPDSDDEALVRNVRRSMDQSTKLPSEFVVRQSLAHTAGHEKWVHARKNNDFGHFAGALETNFDLAREQAELLGYQDHIYDALLDLYEEGGRAADCTRMFDTLRGPTVELVKAITESGNQPDISYLTGDWDETKQKNLTEFVAKSFGFDFDRGRQDPAQHPFCTGWSINDTRITTRYTDFLPSSLFSTMHETGHALYEMGTPEAWDRTPLGGGVSLGVHESQSRTWENIVGRSKAFVSWLRPKLVETFPQLAAIDEATMYRGFNKVEASLIRVEADEVTYNLHVMTRFELECDLLTNKLAVKDLPEAWNAKYKEYLGVDVPSDSDGCLQDVHWSAGLIGYFPTYTMGNLLSYQFWNLLKADLGDVDALMAKGDFAPIHEWLRTNIYSRASRYQPKELVQMVTGKPIGADDYVAALNKKYKDVYSL